MDRVKWFAENGREIRTSKLDMVRLEIKKHPSSPYKGSLRCDPQDFRPPLLYGDSPSPSHPMEGEDRAVDEARTRDPQLGKLMLYQLSYYRISLSLRGQRYIILWI